MKERRSDWREQVLRLLDKWSDLTGRCMAEIKELEAENASLRMRLKQKGKSQLRMLMSGGGVPLRRGRKQLKHKE